MEEKSLIELFEENFKLIFSAIILALVGVGLFTSFYTVQPDEEAVVIRLGKYLTTNSSGLHFKIPFGVDKTYIVKTKLVHREEFGFRTIRNSKFSLSSKKGEVIDESRMLTGDLNVAIVQWVVLYQISDPYKFLFQVRDPKRNIRDISESILRRVVGDQLVSDVLTVGRVKISYSAEKLMQDMLDKYDIGVQIKSVKLQDVNPPELVRPSFNEVNAAKQEQEKLINNAEREYNKIIPEARGKAEKIVSQALGEADVIVNQAMGEAEKFSKLMKSYREGPKIVKKKMYLDTMSTFFKNSKSIKIFDSKAKGLLPIFNKK